jgi:hypothetical protein
MSLRTIVLVGGRVLASVGNVSAEGAVIGSAQKLLTVA